MHGLGWGQRGLLGSLCSEALLLGLRWGSLRWRCWHCRSSAGVFWLVPYQMSRAQCQPGLLQFYQHAHCLLKLPSGGTRPLEWHYHGSAACAKLEPAAKKPCPLSATSFRGLV